MTDDNDNDETVAQAIGFLITVGSMLVVFICALCMAEWTIAGIAIFFAALLWALSYKQIKEYFNNEPEDAASQVHQARQYQDR